MEGKDTHQVCKVLKAAQVAECINPSTQPHVTLPDLASTGVLLPKQLIGCASRDNVGHRRESLDKQVLRCIVVASMS